MKVACALLVFLASAAGQSNSGQPASGSNEATVLRGSGSMEESQGENSVNRTIYLDSRGFWPADVTVQTGNCVTFESDSTEDHDITSELFTTTVEGGDSFTYCFDTAGVYGYYGTGFDEEEAGSGVELSPPLSGEGSPVMPAPAKGKNSKNKQGPKGKKGKKGSRPQGSSNPQPSASGLPQPSASDDTPMPSDSMVPMPSDSMVPMPTDSMAPMPSNSMTPPDAGSVQPNSGLPMSGKSQPNSGEVVGRPRPRPIGPGPLKSGPGPFGPGSQEMEIKAAGTVTVVDYTEPYARQGIFAVAKSSSFMFGGVALAAFAGVALVVAKTRRGAEYTRLNTEPRKQYTV